MAERLTPQQSMAVNNRGGKLLVSAAAGSGKTKVLVDRLMSYLMDPMNPANLDDFLIITYTKAAAAELRGKIATKLTEKISENPDNRHLQQQMQRLYLAKISTVHAFCGDILREYAYRLDIASDFRIADEAECQEVQMLIMDQMLEEAYENAGQDADFCAFIDSQGIGRDDRLIPQIVLQVYNSARCHLDSEGWLNWCVSSMDATEIDDAAQTIWGRYLVDDLHQYLEQQIDSLSQCVWAAQKTDGMEKPAILLSDTLYQLHELNNCNTWDDIVAHKSIDYGRLFFAKSCVNAELKEQIKVVRDACKTGLEKKLRVFAGSSTQVLSDLTAASIAARGLVNLVRRFAAEYDTHKRKRRILDFSDLEHKTLDLLLGRDRSAPTKLSEEIGVRFREIMVDEYQDSNAVQDAIFEALTRKTQNCFMVGDVKQSIYQFRLADPGVFIAKYNSYVDAQNAIAGKGRKVLLSNNFRSSGGVISAVNDVFTACMSERVGGLSYGPQEQLYEGVSHIPLNETEVELHTIPVRQDTYAEEATFVAARIRQLLDGTHMVRQGNALRPILPGDIVILLRSPGSVGGEFAYALEQSGIRCTTGANIDLLQTEEVGTLRSLLQIISNPIQDIPLVAVLNSPVFGFTANDLAEIRSCSFQTDLYHALKMCPLEKATAFISMLTEMRQEARLYTLSQLLHRIFLKTGFDSIYGAMHNGKERKENLRIFSQVVSDYESTGHRNLEQFLEYLDVVQERGLMIPSEQLAAGAVTIMSIHKSKGLEFPVVFLCGLSRSFNRESMRAQVLCHKDLGLGLCSVDMKNRVRYPSIAKRAISVKMLSDSISEEMRVLYVAMTRARDRLIMTYAVKNLEADLKDIAMRMDLSNKLLLTSDVDCPGTWVLLTAMSRTESGQLFALGGRPSVVQHRDPAWKVTVSSAPEQILTTGISEANTPKLSEKIIHDLHDSLSFRYAYAAATQIPSKQTATQLKGRIKDQEAAENTQSVYSAAYRFRKPDFVQHVTHSVEYGNAMHALMQHIRYEFGSNAESLEIEIDRLESLKLLTMEQGNMVNRSQIVRFFNTAVGKRLRSGAKTIREFKFSILENANRYFSGVSGEQILLQGVVDCAIIDSDGITILDFKTDHVTEDTLCSAILKYEQQVKVYANALSRIYGLPIKEAFLYFFQVDKFVSICVE